MIYNFIDKYQQLPPKAAESDSAIRLVEDDIEFGPKQESSLGQFGHWVIGKIKTQTQGYTELLKEKDYKERKAAMEMCNKDLQNRVICGHSHETLEGETLTRSTLDDTLRSKAKSYGLTADRCKERLETEQALQLKMQPGTISAREPHRLSPYYKELCKAIYSHHLCSQHEIDSLQEKLKTSSGIFQLNQNEQQDLDTIFSAIKQQLLQLHTLIKEIDKSHEQDEAITAEFIKNLVNRDESIAGEIREQLIKSLVYHAKAEKIFSSDECQICLEPSTQERPAVYGVAHKPEENSDVAEIHIFGHKECILEAINSREGACPSCGTNAITKYPDTQKPFIVRTVGFKQDETDSPPRKRRKLAASTSHN